MAFNVILFTSLKLLLDEYYECFQTDPIRAHNIEHEIIELTQSTGLYSDTLIEDSDTTETKLNKIDTYLCELKELQIRDGLHIFGKSPKGQELINLVMSIAKTSRKNGLGENKAITQAIADDIGIKLSINPPIKLIINIGIKLLKNIFSDLKSNPALSSVFLTSWVSRLSP